MNRSARQAQQIQQLESRRWQTNDGRDLSWGEMSAFHLMAAATKLKTHADFFRSEGHFEPERDASRMLKLARLKMARLRK